MKGWFDRSGLDPILNNSRHCGAKRHFSKRGAEDVEKRTKNSVNKKYRYKCDMCPNFHMTSRPRSR